MSAPILSISSTPRPAAVSTLNALTTAKTPVLPSETSTQFETFRTAILDRFSPKAPEDIAAVLEYIDATWRLRRIPLQEAELIAIEIRRMQDDPTLAQLLPTLTPTAAEALAMERLFASNALVHLHRLEERLTRRLARVKPLLDFLAERANEREYQRRYTTAAAAGSTKAAPQQPVSLNNEISTTIRNVIDISRNQLCPCGSGQKFKRCCLNKPATEAA